MARRGEHAGMPYGQRGLYTKMTKWPTARANHGSEGRSTPGLSDDRDEVALTCLEVTDERNTDEEDTTPVENKNESAAKFVVK